MTAISASSPGLSAAYQAMALQARQREPQREPPPPPPPVQPAAPAGASAGPGLGGNVDIRA